MPDKVVEPSSPDCCLCARSTPQQRGQRCAHNEPHRYCADHADRIAKIDIRPMCNGVARHTFLPDGVTRCRCTLLAVAGTTVCRKHGANSPGIKRSAARKVVAAKAHARIDVLRQQLGYPVGCDPLKVIQRCVDDAAFWVEYWRSEVHRLADDNGLIGENHLEDEAVRIAYTCFGEALDRAARFAKLALDAGLEERHARAREREVDMYGQMMLAVLAELNIDESIARPVLARHLRALPA